MNWKTWLYGLGTAAIGGAANALTASLVDPKDFNFTHDGMLMMLKIALAGALWPVLTLLKQSPLPPIDSTVAKILLVFALVSAAASAQTAPVQAVTDRENLYMAGLSYNSGANKPIAGTALYARNISDVGTYAFTMIDVLPVTVKPFTVTSNIGAGIAQKAFSIGKFPVFVPTAVGISWSGQDTSYQWSTGAGVPIEIKGTNWYLMPNVRLFKSGLPGGSYQPILGVLFGWGQ